MENNCPRPYQICTRCIMDTSDPEIEFNESGVCNRCRKHEETLQKIILPADQRETALRQLTEKIRAKGKGKTYDCVIGVSGGVDSSYVAYKVKELGLHPLAVHLDNGWNSELAVSNIEKVLKKLEIDLLTEVLDWQEFRDLQLSFLKASVSDAEIPTDHAIWAVLYRAAARHKVSYILSGVNHTTEGILPFSWTYGVKDWYYISGIQNRFGTRKLQSFPHFNLITLAYYQFLKGIKTVNLLDYLDYNKAEAIKILTDRLEWRPYGGKHYESIYTRFFQGYILPRKFGIDKRKAHLSTLIVSGQITREKALDEINHQPYAGYLVEEDHEYVEKKLEISTEYFEELMNLPVKTHHDYRSIDPAIQLIKRIVKTPLVRKIRGDNSLL